MTKAQEMAERADQLLAQGNEPETVSKMVGYKNKASMLKSMAMVRVNRDREKLEEEKRVQLERNQSEQEPEREEEEETKNAEYQYYQYDGMVLQGGRIRAQKKNGMPRWVISIRGHAGLRIQVDKEQAKELKTMLRTIIELEENE